MTDHLLLEYRIQHTLHGCLNILDGLVNDAVQTQVNLLAVCDGLRSSVRTYVKSDDDRIGSGCQGYIGFVDSTNTTMDHLDYNLLVGQFYKTLFYCLYGTLYICLYNDRKLFDITSLDLTEQIIQRQLCLGVFQ